MRYSKKAILQEQQEKKQSINEIAGIVEQLRMKSDWMIKILNPELREKYCKEAVDQGISPESFEKALSILDAMAKCPPPNGTIANAVVPDDENSDVTVVVGGTEFSTSIKVLTADSESMLHRMFRPPWLKPQNGEPIKIETISNSPVVFSHILTYLEALNANRTNLTSNISSLSPEDISFLQADCDYLGLKRLMISLMILNIDQEKEIQQAQEKAASDLYQVESQLKALIEEKKRIEKRLTELPDLISKCETSLEESQKKRLLPVTHWSPGPGDEVMINVSGKNWQKYKIVEEDGTFVAAMVDDNKRRYSSGPKKMPLPEPAFYHPIFTERHHPCDGAVYCDRLFPQPLSRSLETHLDALLHEMPLDLHPGSEGQVVDLIHPSLFPYISGLTQVSDEEAFSECESIEGDYCWLPSEFDVDESGNVTIESYINNLDRMKYSELYLDIAQVFQAMLPLYEEIMGTSLKSKKLQVIVKAAYYFIPPGEEYEGSWHVEGMPHENITASGIYYISASENISNNFLQFRILNDEEGYYHDHGHRAGEEIDLVEEVGSVDTVTDRTLVWENTMQHKVGPLTVSESEPPKKKSKTKAKVVQDSPPTTGIRKILCFFLVDPEKRIVSTKIVPEQQQLIPLDVAMDHRQKLMNERKYLAKSDAEDWESRTYTFCEH